MLLNDCCVVQGIKVCAYSVLMQFLKNIFDPKLIMYLKLTNAEYIQFLFDCYTPVKWVGS